MNINFEKRPEKKNRHLARCNEVGMNKLSYEMRKFFEITLNLCIFYYARLRDFSMIM